MARSTKRTDCHRPGAILPADYSHVMFYALPSSSNGHPMPSIRFNCVYEAGRGVIGQHYGDACCVTRLAETRRFFPIGGAGKCSVCGARFVYGSVFSHTPTGELIHLGHECATKYECLADRSAFEMELDRMRKRRAVEIQRDVNTEAREAFLGENPGLREAFEVEHNIINDIRGRFIRDTAITPKQVALVLKIANDVRNPRQRVEEVKVAAPTGRTTFRGVVVSEKVYEGDWGSSLKITVKVTTPGGIWLAWGTCPRSVLEDRKQPGDERSRTLRGAEVEITATLKHGNEPHFALMGRPNGKVIAFATRTEAA